MRILSAAVAALCFAACSRPDAARAPAAPVIQDSAGVRVVVNPPPETAPVWQVADKPALEIGGDMVEPAYTMFRVRGAVRLADTMIVVANEGTSQVRYYDARSGKAVRTYGGPGDGPDEFKDLLLLGVVHGDSVMVSDYRHRRRLLLDDRGMRGRSPPPLSSANGAYPAAAAALEDGSVLLDPEIPERVAKPGLERLRARMAIVAPDGIERRELGDFPRAESMCDPDPRIVTSCRVGIGVAFGRSLVWAAAKDRVALATTDSFSVRVYDERGKLLHVVRQTREPMPVQKGDFERAQKIALDPMPARIRAAFDPLYAQMPRYETYPALRSVRVDRDGDLWVEDSRRPGDERAVWQIFDRDGVLLGRLTAPERLQITDSGGDYLLGVAKDEDGVERVRMYGLQRVGATSR